MRSDAQLKRLIAAVREMGKTNPCQVVAKFFRLPYELTWHILMGRDIRWKSS